MDVKRRIDSTKKTHQITSAMQMVSTSKLNQIQKHTSTYQVYASKVESIVSHLAKAHLMSASAGVANSNSNTISVSELLAQRPVKRLVYWWSLRTVASLVVTTVTCWNRLTISCGRTRLMPITQSFWRLVALVRISIKERVKRGLWVPRRLWCPNF